MKFRVQLGITFGLFATSKGHSAQCIKLGIRSLELAGKARFCTLEVLETSDISIPQRRGLREKGCNTRNGYKTFEKEGCVQKWKQKHRGIDRILL